MPRFEYDSSPAPAPCAEPHFLVGQDARGCWLAIATHHRAGGIFKSREDALHFVDAETGRRPGAIELSNEPLQLRF